MLTPREKQDLDRHITGNYGENQLKDNEPEANTPETEVIISEVYWTMDFFKSIFSRPRQRLETVAPGDYTLRVGEPDRDGNATIKLLFKE
jgi:hypothetical protein